MSCMMHVLFFVSEVGQASIWLILWLREEAKIKPTSFDIKSRVCNLITKKFS